MNSFSSLDYPPNQQFVPLKHLSTMSERTTFTDLPLEIITNIYMNLDDPSSITALNSTSRQNNLIWKFSTRSISRAVMYNSISNFSTVLELLYLRENIRNVDFTNICNVDFTSDHAPTDRLLEIQQEAWNALSRDEKGSYLGVSLNNGGYSTVLARNQALISNAKKAEHIARLCTSRMSQGTTEIGERMDKRKLHEDFILAYYSIWILETLRTEKAMEERLQSMTETLTDHMAVVRTVLLNDLSEDERVSLGVLRRFTGLHGHHMKASWSEALRMVGSDTLRRELGEGSSQG